MRFFYAMLGACVTNAYLAYKWQNRNNKKVMSLTDFKKELIKVLVANPWSTEMAEKRRREKMGKRSEEERAEHDLREEHGHLKAKMPIKGVRTTWKCTVCG